MASERGGTEQEPKCKAAGKNYGLDCVTGAVYWEDGHQTIVTNCVFCGKENEYD